mmetsp:Transcript_1471/g.2106  ORF Transcript_1471/g.2106 Transcript_1471/m.2106 type:complete len:263 (-) Transcript_1471:222-1010(-)
MRLGVIKGLKALYNLNTTQCVGDDEFVAAEIDKLRAHGVSSRYSNQSLCNPVSSSELTAFGLEMHRIELSTNDSDFVSNSPMSPPSHILHDYVPRHLLQSIKEEPSQQSKFKDRSLELAGATIGEEVVGLSHHVPEREEIQRKIESIGRFISSLHNREKNNPLIGTSNNPNDSNPRSGEDCPEKMIRDIVLSSKISELLRYNYKSCEGSAVTHTCGVCLEDFCEGDSIRELPCFHVFHAKCVDPWLLKNTTCPFCKSEPFRT